MLHLLVPLHVRTNNCPTACRLALNKTNFESSLVCIIPNMPRLDESKRNQAIGMLAVGVTKSEVERRLNCHPSTIARLFRRYRQTGTVKDLPKSGRPRITTRRQDIHIRVTHLRDRFIPATETAGQIRTIHEYVNFLPKEKKIRMPIFLWEF